jgi:hypothetical protein
VKPWSLAGTTVIEGTANGIALGRRNIKAWGKGSDDWVVEFTAPFCRAARLTVGDAIKQVRAAKNEATRQRRASAIAAKLLAPLPKRQAARGPLTGRPALL